MDTLTVLLIKGDPAACTAYVEKIKRNINISLIGVATTKPGALDLIKDNMPEGGIAVGGEEIEKGMNRRIHDELHSVGIKGPRKLGPPSGFEYLTDAIRLTIINSRHYYDDAERRYAATIVYYRDEIAQKYGVSAAHVERAMQKAIDRAWNTADVDALAANYTARLGRYRSTPTVSEFVEYIGKKIKKM